MVFGAGLIGCYLGGVLSHLAFNTQLICRAATREKLLNGIVLSDYQQHESPPIPLQFAEHNSQVKYDYIWLTVKCTAIEQAILDIAPFVHSNSVIFCCQNGLGSDAPVKHAFPNNTVLRVMVAFNVVERRAGHYHRGSQGECVIEQSVAGSYLVENLVDTIKCDYLPVSITNQMSALLWAKLQLNLGNAVNALANIPVKQMLEQRAYRMVIAQLMKELLDVSDRLDITLPKVTSIPAHWIPTVLRLPNFLFKRVANKMLAIDPEVRTSMWWDVSQHKPTEIHFLNGAIVQQANKLGLPCQANQTIVTLIELLSQVQPDKQYCHKAMSAEELVLAIKSGIN